jgi:cob(I)alamin adenosyltransferase
MKIYTKKGDKGQTSLIGGTRVDKHHIRIEAYGTVDELNSYIGLIRDQEMDMASKELLIHIQDRLFTIGSLLASDPEKSKMKLPQINLVDIERLEKEMDQINTGIPEMRSFVLPGGHPTVSHCHIARCICRRAERKATYLAASSPVQEEIIKYLNRLSDYLFVLARKLSYDLKITEVPWKPLM